MGTRRPERAKSVLIDPLVAEAERLQQTFGFTAHKLKAGVFHPDYELEAYRALAASLPGDSCSFHPNGVLSTEQAIRFAQATNTVVVNFEQLAQNVLNPAVNVIFLDTTFWEGIRPWVKAADAHYHHGPGLRKSKAKLH